MNSKTLYAHLFLVATSSVCAKEASPDVRLLYARDVLRAVVRAERSADLFKDNPQFAHYRAAIGVLEKSHCAGAYAARCDRFKKEFIEHDTVLLTETDFAGKLQGLSMLAVHAAALVDEAASPEAVRALKDVAGPLKASISGADPAQYAAIAEAYQQWRASVSADQWRVVSEKIQDLSSDMLGIGNGTDTEEAVAAAEARLREKNK